MKIEPVVKSILVRTSQEHAFNVFTNGQWWPKGHSILASGSPQKEVVIEPKVGGRWYEIGEDGTQCQWGSVLICDFPKRLVMTWQLNGNFELEISHSTEVEVHFVPQHEGTLVTLEHRFFENFETGQQLRDSVDSNGGWSSLLKEFAAQIDNEPQKMT